MALQAVKPPWEAQSPRCDPPKFGPIDRMRAGRIADLNGGQLTISEPFFPKHQVTGGSHPSYRHEEPPSPKTEINLLTGGLLVRIQPEEPIFSTTYGNDFRASGSRCPFPALFCTG